MDETWIKPPRRRLPRSTREAQIKAAALAVFREHGYQGASISQIAALAGLADGALYRYYASKKEILESVICQWYEGILENYQERLDEITVADQRLEYAIRHNISCHCEDPNIANLYYELRRDRDFKSSRLIEYNRRYIGILLGIIKSIRGSGGKADAIKMVTICRVLYSSIETATERFRIHQEPLDQEALTGEIFKVAKKLI